MNPQAKKNIRQAFLGQSTAFEMPAWHASQAAVRYIERQAPEVDRVLAAMDLLIIAQRALLAGEDLEAVGGSGPYGTATQRRAWAAGRLSAACNAMVVAEKLAENQQRISKLLARKDEKIARLTASNRAAWKATNIDVPFREPKPTGRVDWLMGEN
jgi:hypothetical protein